MVISARAATRFLGTFVGTLAVLHVAGSAVRLTTHHDYIFGLLPLTNLDVEQGLGTWYAGIAWLIAAGITALLAHEKALRADPHTRAWRGLAAIFAYLSADEMLSLHELLNYVTRAFIPAEGIFHWSWWMLGAPIALAVGLAYVRFLLSLPARFRWLFVSAGALFFTGAIGFEVVESGVVAGGAANTAQYDLLVLIEETLEMSGVVVLIYALITYVAEVCPSVGLRFEVGTSPAAAPAAVPLPPPVMAPAYSPMLPSRPTPVASDRHSR